MLRRIVAGDSWFLLLVVALRLISDASSTVAFLLVAAYAWAGRRQSIIAIFVCFLMVMVNRGLAADASFATTGRYLIFLSAAGANLIRFQWPSGSAHRIVVATLALGAALCLHSLAISPVVDVSLLKASSWAVVMATLLSAWSSLNHENRSLLAHQIFGGLILVVVCSAPLIFTPVGYYVNGSGFQGVLAHPQTFGPVVSLIAVWGAARLLESKAPKWRNLAFISICAVMIFLSESRIAGGAFVLGLSAAVVAGRFIALRPITELLPGIRSRRLHLIVGLMVAVGVVLSPVLAPKFDAYLSKRTDSTTIAEAYQASRGALIEVMFANIKTNPLTGIGFGIASDYRTMAVERDPILGLPISAAIEKGVMPVAVLEEIGVFGLMGVIAWLAYVLRRAVLNNGIPALAVIFGIVVLNLGENTLFSSGGLGMLTMVLIGWGATEGRSGA